MNARSWTVLLPIVVALSGCASGTDAIYRTMRTAVGRDGGVEGARLNPNFRYLRVTIEGRVALLALGNIDSHPQGAIEVWYSAEREVLRLQNGRLVGAAGLTTEWRNVVLPELPAWTSRAHAGVPVRWVRTRDVMPGYRYGVRDALVLSVTPQPPKSALQGLDPQSLTWFEERFVSEAAGKNVLPPARYAVQMKPHHPAPPGGAPLLGEEGKVKGSTTPPPAAAPLLGEGGTGTVVYGEQCLAPQTCFTWQRWPAGS